MSNDLSRDFNIKLHEKRAKNEHFSIIITLRSVKKYIFGQFIFVQSIPYIKKTLSVNIGKELSPCIHNLK